MIKINLLESVTERQGSAAVAVERKIGSPVSRLVLMTGVVVFLLFAVVSWDFVSTYMAKKSAERQLEEQKQIQTELQAILKEQKELEQKIQNIDKRIDAIKKLRASQAGPSAVLDAMVERISMVPGLYLESVEQAGDQLTIKGSSPDESQVTQFGRSLEFSGGLFSNLNIETERKELQNQRASSSNPDAEAPKVEIVGFTIRCAYTPEKSGSSGDSMTAQNTPPTGAAPAAPATPAAQPQIAKN